MFGSTVLAVVIGLVFVYFVFSMACSKINEVVSARLQWRADTLEKWLRKSLDPRSPGTSTPPAITAERLKGSSLITSITPEAAKNGLPSYLAPQTFSLAILDLLAPGDGQVTTLNEVRAALADLPAGHPAKAPLTRAAIEAGDDLAAFRAGVERWFNDSMARVSGWYKRRVQRWMLVYAAALTILLNVDTVAIARTLWNQDTVRQTVVAQAQRSPDADVIDKVSRIKTLGVPIGWAFDKKASTAKATVVDNTATDDKTDPRRWPGADAGAWLVKLLGLAITIGALSLGAPFWFDVLNKIARLRSTGDRPPTTAPTPPPVPPAATVIAVQPAPVTQPTAGVASLALEATGPNGAH